MTLTLLNYGSGNVRSVAKALEAASQMPVRLTAEPKDVASASRLVVPGQGAFGQCHAGLRAVPGLLEAVHQAVLHHRIPYLGICVGMQLMLDEGVEDGIHPGFGWIRGQVAALKPADPDLKIPHMGWNSLALKTPHPVLDAADQQDVYFCHSYAAVPGLENQQQILAVSDYGGPLVAAIGQENMLGVQFHPEKSQAVGLNLLSAFTRWMP